MASANEGRYIRDNDRGQDTQDGDDDQEFDEGEAFFTWEGVGEFLF